MYQHLGFGNRDRSWLLPDVIHIWPKCLKKHICKKESIILWGETWNRFKWNFLFIEVHYCRFSALTKLNFLLSGCQMLDFTPFLSGLFLWCNCIAWTFSTSFIPFLREITFFSLSVYVRISNFDRDLSNFQINRYTMYFFKC